jgi:hypothetical protein
MQVGSNYMKKNENNTIIDSEGKILFFGLNDFLTEIAQKNNCFICGAEPSTKKFNDEHVIPDWILKKYKLHSKKITLTNGSKLNYGHYKIPCCQDCNTELGKIYELPLSKLLSKPYTEICHEIDANPEISKLIFKWLSIIFIKTHLKDKSLLKERDLSKQTGFIGDNHYWEDMHHVHCISRSHYTNAIIDIQVYGTLLVLPALCNEGTDDFDYIDSESGKAVMLKLGEFCVVAVLNDSGATYSLFAEVIRKINGPLTSFQIREIVAHLNFLNLSLKDKPVYQSSIKGNGEYKIITILPEKINLIDEVEGSVTAGDFLRYYVENMIGDIENREQILDEIQKGTRNYLLDEKGEFINHSL